MSTDLGNIDELLTQQKPVASQQQEQNNDNYNDDNSTDNDYSNDSNDEVKSEREQTTSRDSNETDTHEERNIDDYGNEKAASKVYTEDEVNERINKAVRERLARANHQANQQPVQQQQQNQQVDYNSEADGDWQQQLEQFVEQTFSKMTQKQAQKHQQEIEKAAEAEFADKFSAGMERFHDFIEVVESKPITVPMTMALRGIKDPAAFVYAASKRHPQELERISKLKDPYSQMVEVGKLEERMRKRAEGTTAPRPIGRSQEDSTMSYETKKAKEESIEDMIQKSEQKRIAKMRQLRGK
jgi:hypothetical protein